jgi:putative nucleotidyltransferase with HDIG domain
LRLPRTTLRTSDPRSGTNFATVSEIVPRGTVVDSPQTAALVRLYERDRRPPNLPHMAAHWVVYFLALVMLTTYMRKGHAAPAGLLRTQVGMLFLAAVFLVGNKALLLFTDLTAHLMPIALVPLWTAYYLDRRTGVLMSAVLTLLSASLISYDPIVSVTYFIAAAAGALTMRQRKRMRLVLSGMTSGLVGATVYVAAKEIFDGFSPSAELAASWQSGPVATIMAGAASGLLALALEPFTAALLGVVSRSQLMNLTDLDQPLLKKMAAEAPGSWEHSRAMANLAEAAAASIHADALLTRTGAYYHDLGKSCQSKYYVENLEAGERSPHEGLDPDVSADAIMAHVIEGVRILREGGIPEPVVEFAYTHHGTGLIEYFWHKCLKEGNPKGLTEDAFHYPGMRPRTKETAILMLIDAIEAGSRTVNPPSREGFEGLVQRVIFTKLRQGQLDDAGLSLEELRIVGNQITDTLCSIHHTRIKYPWQEKEEQAAKDREQKEKGKEPTGKGKEPAGKGKEPTGKDREPTGKDREPASKNRAPRERADSTQDALRTGNGEDRRGSGPRDAPTRDSDSELRASRPPAPRTGSAAR